MSATGKLAIAAKAVDILTGDNLANAQIGGLERAAQSLDTSAVRLRDSGEAANAGVFDVAAAAVARGNKQFKALIDDLGTKAAGTSVQPDNLQRASELMRGLQGHFADASNNQQFASVPAPAPKGKGGLST